MSFVRTFEDFSPPPRFDGLPFVSVEIQEGPTQDGPFAPIDTITLIPTDADPSRPESRDFTTANATLNPAWYVLVWIDNALAFFPSEPISSLRRAFVSIQDLGNALGFDLLGDDAALDAIDAACDVCRTVSEQTLTLVEGETIVLDGTGTDALLLPERPVTQVLSVEDEGELVTDWVLNDNGVLIRKTDNGNPSVWSAGRQRYAVAYDHGYAAVPGDVKMVALAIASRMIVQGVASFESSGSQQIRYGTNSTDLTLGERMILRKYKQSR